MPQAEKTPKAHAASLRVRDDAGRGSQGDGRHARARATRDRLRQVASELFAQHGYSGTSLDEIAEKAGVSKGTIFYNFGSKDGLGGAVILDSTDHIGKRMAAAAEGPSGWEAITAICNAVLDCVSDEPHLLQVVSSELFRHDRPWSEALPRAKAELMAPLINAISEVRAALPQESRGAEELRTDPEIEQVAVAILGATLFVALDHARFSPEEPITVVQNRLANTLGLLLGH